MKIVNEHGTECAFSEYLETLEIDQLERAKTVAQDNIDRIKAQPKVKLIRIGDAWVVYRYFALADYEEAVAYMARKAMKDFAKEGAHEIRLDFRTMYSEEAADTLNNWNGEADA